MYLPSDGVVGVVTVVCVVRSIVVGIFLLCVLLVLYPGSSLGWMCLVYSCLIVVGMAVGGRLGVRGCCGFVCFLGGGRSVMLLWKGSVCVVY